MSLLTRLLPTFLRSTAMAINAPSTSLIAATATPTPRLTEAVACLSPLGLFGQSIRTTIRCHFPRPSERKRIKRHGYKARMSTPGGRRVLMRRILKGKFVLSH